MKNARSFLLFVLLAAFIFIGAVAPAKPVQASGNTYTVSVASGYLALRTAPAFDSRNEIGKLYNGDTVEVSEYCSGGYWWVYSPKYDRYGYVNNDYLYSQGQGGGNYGTYTVSVASGYLALRTTPTYDASNEIGELYSGDTVTVKEKTYSDYWWVYSPKYNRNGYVNCNYLYSGSSYNNNSSYSGNQYTVSVKSGYLAIRSAPSYNKTDELGRLYNGDVVTLQEKTNSSYWYIYSDKLGIYGYVNASYLTGSNQGYICSMTVSVKKGYLALRSAMAYDSSNEIGALYTGDTVQVIEKTSNKYWYVYSPKLNKYGYVNKDYLY